MLFARQPIFNTENKVVAYEFLYRNEVTDDISTDLEKTVDVLTNVNTFFFNYDIDTSKKMFLNFDRSLLLDNIMDVLSPTEHVIEILETVEEEKIIVNRLIQLKRVGFKIAIDDYKVGYKNEEFINLADYIKVDFMANSLEEIIQLSKKEKFKKKILLAEKVENENMHHLALKLNYKLFQGFYYAKPIVHKGNYISINVKSCLEIIKKLNTPKFTQSGERFIDLLKISKYIERDPVLAFKVLRIANSIRANIYIKIDSIQRAVSLLGYKKLNRWLKILLFQEVKTRGKNRDRLNKEVIRTIIIRTSFVENIILETPLLDILFDMTMKEIVESLDLSGDISDALLNEKGLLYKLLHLLRSYEAGNWEEVGVMCQMLGIDYTKLPDIYTKSVQDSSEIVEDMEKI